MHMGNVVHDAIVLVGWEDHAAPSGIKCAGTAFLLHYQRAPYLVTAGHVAKVLEGSPFVIRVNRNNRAELLPADDIRWVYHSDPLVDLAAIPFALPAKDSFQIKYLREDMIGTREALAAESIDVGDLCYTVGLFHLVHGQTRNMPMVHSGSIALMPPEGERIPVGNKATGKTDWVEGYLIESRAINGASGSPVFLPAQQSPHVT